MAPRPTRSLKHEYELFLEHEIENYKESVPRSVLLSIGDEAVSSLAQQQQLALTELLLCEEVDRIIFRRLRLPGYVTWRRRRVKMIAELRRPEHWGLRPDDALVRALRPTGDGRVLVADGGDDVASLYFAAHGCDVTTIAAEVEAVERVMQAAIHAGLGERVHAHIGDLASWTPQVPLNAVIVNPAALEELSFSERARVIDLLQTATMDGGVHLVRALVASTNGGATLSLDELRSQYRGWDVKVERAEGNGRGKTFLARKGAA
jgi:hypothetical protein